MAETKQKYPFIAELTGKDHVDDKRNRIAKIHAYYFDRKKYEEVVHKDPSQRLASDRTVTPKVKSEKLARSDRKKQTIEKKKDDQLGIF